jgi:hypothetical protein
MMKLEKMEDKKIIRKGRRRKIREGFSLTPGVWTTCGGRAMYCYHADINKLRPMDMCAVPLKCKFGCIISGNA